MKNPTDERLIGRLEEFKDWAGEEFQELHSILKEIREDLKAIHKDRWILQGKLVVISSGLTLVIEYLIKMKG